MKKETFVIHCPETGLYVREIAPGDYCPDAADTHADCFTREQAESIVSQMLPKLATPCTFTVEEAKVSQYFRWQGRKGGKIVTPAKRIANARRARNKRKTWIFTTKPILPTI